MKAAQDLIPWKVTDISVYPYGADWWSMNPSVHLDTDGTWRCVARIVDYAMPDGVTIRSKGSRSVGQQTKNAMVIFDPGTWQPIKIYKMHERDGLPRASTPHVGYEDMRLFRTDKGGLQGIAASLHLQRDQEQRAAEWAPQHQPPEQVLLSFDGEYNIVEAHPIRGDGWSSTPQKNWAPFDDCAEPRLLYAIDKGRIFDDRGPLHGKEARVIPSTRSRSGAPSVPSTELAAIADRPAPQIDPADLSQLEPDSPQSQEQPERSKKKSTRKVPVRGGDTRIVRGGRIKLDTMTSRPSSRPSRSSSRSTAARSADDSTRLMGAGRVLLPKYEGLRGGTQLVRVGDDAWLGIGHEMKFMSGRKYYWHTWYLTDSFGRMKAASEPMKLALNGIEFAAGMAIDDDRVVVSFGVDDMYSMLGETRLSAVMELLRSVER